METQVPPLNLPSGLVPMMNDLAGAGDAMDNPTFQDVVMAVRDLSWKVDSGLRMLDQRLSSLENRLEGSMPSSGESLDEPSTPSAKRFRSSGPLSKPPSLASSPWTPHVFGSIMDAIGSSSERPKEEVLELDTLAKRLTKSIRTMLAKLEGPVIVKLSPSDFAHDIVDSPEFGQMIPEPMSENDIAYVKDLCIRKIKDAVSNRKKSLKKKVGMDMWNKTGEILDDQTVSLEKASLRNHLLELQQRQIQAEAQFPGDYHDDDPDLNVVVDEHDD